MLVLMTEATLSPYFADGPIYPPNGFEVDYCEDSWWRNLLYINNLFDMDKIVRNTLYFILLLSVTNFIFVNGLLLIFANLAIGIRCFALKMLNAVIHQQ